MARGGDNTGTAQLHIGLGAVALDLARTGSAKAAHDGRQRGVGANADNGVDLGDLLHDLLLVALGQAAGDDDLQVRVLLLVLAGHQNVLDGFGLGGLDKAAGVDDDDVCFGRVRHGGVAVLDEGVAENVGVHLVFGAAEGDDRNLHRTSFIYSMFLRCQSSASAARMTLWLNPRRASAAATWSRLPAASLAA